MEENKSSIILTIIFVILIICLIFKPTHYSNIERSGEYTFSDSERIYELEKEVSDLNSENEDLKEEYNYYKEYVNLLQNQLLEHNIEPYEF